MERDVPGGFDFFEMMRESRWNALFLRKKYGAGDGSKIFLLHLNFDTHSSKLSNGVVWLQ